MLVLMLMSMLMSHASVDLFVLSFVLPCAYAYVASENQALEVKGLSTDRKAKLDGFPLLLHGQNATTCCKLLILPAVNLQHVC